MPFGRSNAPATLKPRLFNAPVDFQDVNNNVLPEKMYVSCIVCLDDVLDQGLESSCDPDFVAVHG